MKHVCGCSFIATTAVERSPLYEPPPPVFTVGDLTFGIIICNDSNYYEPARIMASKGAAALFVPTNNGLPPTKAGPELVTEARNCDIARAVENSLWVIRADVAGCTESLVSYGSSGIVSPDGMVLQSARQLGPDIIVAEIKTAPREHLQVTEPAGMYPSTARQRA